jgi:thiamine transporter
VKKQWDTRVLVEIGVAAALAMILGMLRLFRGPQGGSITLEMVPIFVVSFRHGVRPGVWSGVIMGLLKLLLGAYIVHPIQLVMDYVLPFALLGLAGMFYRKPALGVAIGSAARYVVHVLAGVIFWAVYAPQGMNPWVYSISYNAGYLIPSAILSGLVIWLLSKNPVLLRVREK